MNHFGWPAWVLSLILLASIPLELFAWRWTDRRRPRPHRIPVAPLPPIQATYTRPTPPPPKEIQP